VAKEFAGIGEGRASWIVEKRHVEVRQKEERATLFRFDLRNKREIRYRTSHGYAYARKGNRSDESVGSWGK